MNKDIHLNTPMLKALNEGCDSYQPVFDGEPLEVESGVPEVSLRNLRKITSLNRRVVSMCVGAKAKVLVVFDTGESYLATGFTVGRKGKEVRCFAKFAAEALGGRASDWQQFLAAIDGGWRGPLPPLPTGTGLRVHSEDQSEAD